MRAERSDAIIAASECGTAKLERMMMLMNDELRPVAQLIKKESKVIGNHTGHWKPMIPLPEVRGRTISLINIYFSQTESL